MNFAFNNKLNSIAVLTLLLLAGFTGYRALLPQTESCSMSSLEFDGDSLLVNGQRYSLQEARDCRRYLEPQMLSYADRVRLHGPLQYRGRNQTRERVQTNSNDLTSVLVREYFPLAMNSSSQTTIVSMLQEEEARTQRGGASFRGSLTSFEETADELVDFVLQIYGQRRTHWSPEFLAKLRQVAKAYLEQSVYIEVRDGFLASLGRQGSLLRGTIRLIKEKNGRVPMEEYLNIQVNVGDKFKVEPGNFAVEKDFSLEAWAELIMHLTSKKLSRFSEDVENHYLTYADEYSLVLYSQLGFKPVPFAKINFGDDVVVEGGKIIKDGVAWTPMEASADDLQQILIGYLEKLKRRSGSEDVIRSIQDRQKEIDIQPNSAQRLIGQGHFEGEPVRVLLEVDIDEQRKIVNINFQSYQSEKHFTLHVGSFDSSLLPLKEGLVRHSQGFDLSYSAGVLTIASSSSSYEIETNPMLTSIQMVRFKHNGKVQVESFF